MVRYQKAPNGVVKAVFSRSAGVQLDLVVTRIGIQKRQQLASGCGVNHLIYLMQRKRILGAGFVETGVINAQAPLGILLRYKDRVGKPL